jgi:hypothetical protein
MIIFGAALVVLYLVLWAWHSPWVGKLSKAEIDRFLAIIEKRLLPAEEIKAFTSRIRSWAEADDGRPVYMFNLEAEFESVAKSWRLKGRPAHCECLDVAPSVTLWSHTAFPELRADRPYHQHGDDRSP